jgi:hypothetical protein
MYIGDAACQEALPYILEADAAKARAAESGTNFTSFTGTKVQILTRC